jgi:hypothetical protein
MTHIFPPFEHDRGRQECAHERTHSCMHSLSLSLSLSLNVISWIAEQLLASEEGLCSVESVNYLVR